MASVDSPPWPSLVDPPFGLLWWTLLSGLWWTLDPPPWLIFGPSSLDFFEPEESPVIPINDDNPYEGNGIGGSADQTDHLPIPLPSSPITPTHNNDLGPAPHTSEITDDLIDSALQAPPIPNISTPSPPLTTTPSRSHTSPSQLAYS
ncbi:hypothetical protein BD769DRAFT_1663460 [Suillus cothurnatus]|nr:hypothetical protein BD769DRAFT_1663460 [Suillus cothurnatus]